MPELRFRVSFGGVPATLDDLARIDEITVDQAEDAAWEARLTLTLALDAAGHWSLQNDARLEPRTAVRIELQIGTAPFKPLIDGPIVGIESAMDSRPGRSVISLVVHDDSAWLNRESGPFTAEGRTADQIARELFLTRSEGRVVVANIEIPPGTAPPSFGEKFAQLGTPMQMLRHLAERHGCHAYVLPGPLPGQSIGCLLPDPIAPPTLPPLVLLGPSRNLADVTVTNDPDSAERTTVHTLRLSDQQVSSYTTRLEDEDLLESRPSASDAPTRTAPAGGGAGEDPAAAARARTRRRNFPVKFTGRTLPGSYPQILQPHQKVALHAGGASASTVLLLTKVTHRITPSAYTVDFEGRGNSLADLQASVPGIPAGIF